MTPKNKIIPLLFEIQELMLSGRGGLETPSIIHSKTNELLDEVPRLEPEDKHFLGKPLLVIADYLATKQSSTSLTALRAYWGAMLYTSFSGKTDPCASDKAPDAASLRQAIEGALKTAEVAVQLEPAKTVKLMKVTFTSFPTSNQFCRIADFVIKHAEAAAKVEPEATKDVLDTLYAVCLDRHQWEAKFDMSTGGNGLCSVDGNTAKMEYTDKIKQKQLQLVRLVDLAMVTTVFVATCRPQP